MRLIKVTKEGKIILTNFSADIPVPAKARKTERGRQWRPEPQTLTEAQPANAVDDALEILLPLFDAPIICGVRDNNPKQLRIKIPENEAFTTEDAVELLRAIIS